MKKIQGILFDCDGVLLDSEYNQRKIIHKLLQENVENYKLSFDDFMKVSRGLDAFQTKSLLESYGLNIPEMLFLNYLKEFEGRYTDFADKVNNVEKMLEELTGFKKAVCSNNWVSVYQKALVKHDIEKHFETLVGQDQVEKGKPEPHVYLEGGKRLDIPMENCLAIEDTPGIGLTAAKASGAGVLVGFTGSGSSAEDLINAGAHHTIDCLLELPKLIEKINKSS